MGELEDDLRREIVEGRAVVVVGSGVSLGATDRNELASWTGLLRNGVSRCVELRGGALPAGWRKRQLAACESTDLDDVLGVAQQVEKTLRAPRRGEYASWLRGTVGSLRATDPSLLEALRDLNCPIATTNYDGLLEETTGLPAITWRSNEGANAVRFLRGESRSILHLHGYWEEPDSVVFGLRSYQELLIADHAQHLQHALAIDKTLVFVGCGVGLKDPNFESLRRWMAGALQSAEHRHYRLAPKHEVSHLRRVHAADGIHVLAYGDNHSELAPFLRSLRSHPPAARKSARRLLIVAPLILVTIAIGAWLLYNALASPEEEIEPRFGAAALEKIRTYTQVGQDAADNDVPLPRDPEGALDLLDKGRKLEASEQYDLALDSFEGAFSMDSGSITPLVSAAGVLRKQKKIEESEAMYLRALGLNDNDSSAHNNYGLLLMEAGRNSEARDHFARAAAMGQSSAHVFNQARAEARLGNDENALWLLEEALKSGDANLWREKAKADASFKALRALPRFRILIYLRVIAPGNSQQGEERATRFSPEGYAEERRCDQQESRARV